MPAELIREKKMKTYLWCEDRGSGFSFFRELFEVVRPEIIVLSKRNNSQLRQAVERITDTVNRYVIVMDAAIDNPDVLRELTKVERVAAEKPNVTLVKVPCFEFILLSFTHLESWMYAEGSRMEAHRAGLIRAKELFVRMVLEGGNAADYAELRRLLPNLYNHNTEQIAAKLLTELTQNTGFLTTKGKLGVCFTEDCCSYPEHGKGNSCGLFEARLSAEEKKRELMEYSILGDAFEKAGL